LRTSSPPERSVYQGPDYRAAISLPLDPLVHPDPWKLSRLYRVVLAVVRLLIRVFFRVRVEGLENLPPPPFMIASNHQAWYDTIFILATFPTPPMIYTMARRDTIFNRAWKRWLLPRFGVFPIAPSRGELDAAGVATVYQVLARGGVVLIFPEGRYSRGRALRPLKKGVAHFALQAGVPIVPVALSGLDRLRPLGRARISIAPPIRPDPPGWWALNRRVEGLVARVRGSILNALGGRTDQPAGDGSGRPRRRLFRRRRRSRDDGPPPLK
jgi:1-acyl-sn-glycerol-3-phosphate acyltransferase